MVVVKVTQDSHQAEALEVTSARYLGGARGSVISKERVLGSYSEQYVNGKR